MPAPADRRATGDRLPALDGVRAVAIAVVMAFHAGLPGLGTGGFFGQDTFFVLSGLLITTLLLRETARRGRVDLVRFWGARVRRLLPALVAMLVVVAGYVRFVAPPGRYPGFAGDARSALLYYANWHLIGASSDYFAQTAHPSLLTHTWSLAVEEQYYVVWPLVVAALAWLLRRRTATSLPWAVLTVAVGGTVASAALMAVERVRGVSPTHLYYDTSTHAQCLLVGSALAAGLVLLRERADGPGLFPEVRGARATGALGVTAAVGTVGLGLVWTHVPASAPFADEGGFLVVSLCTAAVLVAAACAPRGPLARLLGARPVALVGLVSYAAYLWYFPVFAVVTGASTGLRSWPLFGVRVAVVLALAALSHVLVERPFQRSVALRLDGRTWAGRLRPALVVGALLVTTLGASEVTGIARAAPRPQTAPTTGPAPVAPVGASRRVLVVGDSTAVTLGLVLQVPEVQRRYGYTVVDDGVLGCGLLVADEVRAGGRAAAADVRCDRSTPVAQQWDGRLQREVTESRPDVVLVAAGRWEVVDHRDTGGAWTSVTDPVDAAAVRAELDRSVAIAAAGGARVALATAPCFDTGEQPDGRPWSEDDPARVAAYNALVAQVAAAHPGTVTVVPVGGLVCPGGRFRTTLGGLVVRAPDGIHYPFEDFTRPAAAAPDTAGEVEAFARWLLPQVAPSLLGSCSGEPCP